jgi:hypothetical protein
MQLNGRLYVASSEPLKFGTSAKDNNIFLFLFFCLDGVDCLAYSIS